MSLPTPPPRYDPQDARETRRQLEQRLARLESLVDARDLQIAGGTLTGILKVDHDGNTFQSIGDDASYLAWFTDAGVRRGFLGFDNNQPNNNVNWQNEAGGGIALTPDTGRAVKLAGDTDVTGDLSASGGLTAGTLALTGTTATVNGATLARVQSATTAPSGAPDGGVGTIHLQVT